MSRSRKKFPCIKCGSMGKFGKIVCNRKVRRAKDISSGSAYRKVGSSFDIWDLKDTKRPEEIENRDWEYKKDYISK